MDLAHITFEGASVPAADCGRTAERRARTFRGGPFGYAAAHDDSVAVCVLSTAGIDASAYRDGPLRRRSAACLRRLRTAESQHARHLVVQSREVAERSLDSVLIGVSAFFRDAGVFDRLAREILPELVRTFGRLRILSAGCADGQELYSVAALLAEMTALDNACLVGIDCRRSALRNASLGIYEDAATAGIPARLRERYFRPLGDYRQVAEPLRRHCAWHRGDLLALDYAAQWHLILFRNVAIYLRPEAATGVWTRLVDQLVPGGVLVTGKGEHPPRGLPLVHVGTSLYRRL